MTRTVKITVVDNPTRAKVLIDGQNVESRVCKYTLEHVAGNDPVLHLYVPILKADIEIGGCEVEEHEINPGI